MASNAPESEAEAVKPKANRPQTTPLQREQRRELVASGIKSGLSYRQIVELIKKTGTSASLKSVATDVAELSMRWRVNADRDVGEAKALDLARIDDVLKALQTKMLRGDPVAIREYLKAIQIRADILGYSAPAKRAVGGWEGAPPIPLRDATPDPDLSKVPTSWLDAQLAALEAAGGLDDD